MMWSLLERRCSPPMLVGSVILARCKSELLAMPELVERLAEQIRLVRWSLRPEIHPRVLLVLHSFIDELMR